MCVLLISTLIPIIILGFIVSGDGAMGDVSTYTESILQHLNFTFWLVIPPIAVITLILLKVPAIPCLITGLLLGGISYLLFQGGIKDHTGMLHSIVLKLSRFVGTIGNLTVTVLLTSLFLNIFAANQYLAVILPGQMFEENYRDLDLKLKNLTRTLEGGGTLTAPLIPWNSSAVFVSSALGISAASYAPYAIFCWLTPIVLSIFAYANFSMERVEPMEPEPEAQQ
ncbi:MAG: hypothetical protein EOM67_11945 [Spirochaetia bacterium]|nr:hypothetical protein [Spirochaetia bacterium]